MPILSPIISSPRYDGRSPSSIDMGKARPGFFGPISLCWTPGLAERNSCAPSSEAPLTRRQCRRQPKECRDPALSRRGLVISGRFRQFCRRRRIAGVLYSTKEGSVTTPNVREMLKMTKCRKCKAPINMKLTVTTPTCPVCGAWWPQGLQGFWVIVAVLAGAVVWMLLK